MKRLSLLITALALSTIAFSQIVPDRDQWTCNGTHDKLYTHLNAGKVVLVAMQGLDCPGCAVNSASIDSFATNNKTKVKTWAALQMMSGSGGTCTDVNKWMQTHGYADIFTFLDSTNYWASNYTGAEFLVISPVDKKVKYQGLDMSKAFAEARKIFDPTSIKSAAKQNTVSIYPNPAHQSITLKVEDKSTVKIMSIVGGVVMNNVMERGSHTVNVSNLSNGIYIVSVITEEAHFQTRFVKN